MKTSPIFVGGGYTMNSQSNEKNMDMNRTNQGTPNIRWMLVGYDLVVYVVVAIILLVLYPKRFRGRP